MQNTSNLPPPGDRPLIKSAAPIMSLSVPGVGGWGFQLTSALHNLVETLKRIWRNSKVARVHYELSNSFKLPLSHVNASVHL